jgi:hypothetical protein
VLDWNLIAQDAIAVGRPPASSQVLAASSRWPSTTPWSPSVAAPGRTPPARSRPGPSPRRPRPPPPPTTCWSPASPAIPDGPAFEPVAPTPPVDVALAQVRPLTFRSPSRFRPDGPTRLGGRAYARDLAEVQALGRADSTVRSPAQTEAARFWSENTFVQWGRNLRALATTRRLGVRDSARLLAMAHTATADAVIGCFDAKYHYTFWRPVHAIARAGADPATHPDPTWTALLTVNHPEYPRPTAAGPPPWPTPSASSSAPTSSGWRSTAPSPAPAATTGACARWSARSGWPASPAACTSATPWATARTSAGGSPTTSPATTSSLGDGGGGRRRG